MLSRTSRRNSVRFALAILFGVTTLAQTQPYTIHTFAGGVHENIPAISADLGPMSAMAVDPSGNLYLALSNFNVIERVGQNGMLTRVAGNGTSGFSGDDGPATQAQLAAVSSLAAAPNGDLYIADAGNNRIRRVSNGTITTVAGGGTEAPGPAPLPATSVSLSGGASSSTLITLDASGNLIIAIIGPVGPALLKLSDNTVTQLPFSTGVCSVSVPSTSHNVGLTADASGKIYLASYSVYKEPFGPLETQGCVVSFPSNDVILNGVFSSLAVDSNGVLYYINGTSVGQVGLSNPVAGKGGQNATTGDGGPATQASLNLPAQLAVDGQNNIYIVQNGDNRVRKVSNGIITTVAGTHPGDGEPAIGAQLSASGAAVGPDGSLYIADSKYNRIRKITNGIITTIAGTGDPGYTGDGGPATAAQLNAPQGIALDNAGNIYVADTQNAVIRKIANGLITTIATGSSSSLPQAVVVSPSGKLFIASGSIAVQVVNGTWNPSPNLFAYPISGSLAMDGSGNLYAVNYSGGAILEWSSGVTSVIGGLPQAYSVAVDRNGTLYAAAFKTADPAHTRQIELLADGVFTHIAGGGTETADGIPALSALLTNAQLLAVDATGRVYISDNGLIRVLVPPAGGLDVNAAMSSPSPAATLTSSSATFNWTAGANALEYHLYVGTTPRGTDIFTANQGMNHSVTVTSLPTNGATLYVTLWTHFADQGWQPVDYVYNAVSAPGSLDVTAVMSSPAPASTLTSSGATFNWTAGANALEYHLYVGTTPRGTDIFTANQGMNHSVTVTGLPTNGATLYVTLWTHFADQGWQPVDYVYNAVSAAGGPDVIAVMSSPAPASTLTSSSATFNWTAGANALAYHLYVGTTPRGTDVFNAYQFTNHSVTVSGLPTNGVTLYVTLWTQFADKGWQPVDYVYNAVSAAGGPDVTAVMGSPAPVSSLTSSSVTFNWTAGANALAYHLYVGTTLRGTDIFNAYQFRNHSVTVTGLPTNGTTLYVTLWTQFADQGWQPADYVYNAR